MTPVSSSVLRSFPVSTDASGSGGDNVRVVGSEHHVSGTDVKRGKHDSRSGSRSGGDGGGRRERACTGSRHPKNDSGGNVSCLQVNQYHPLT